MRILTTALPKRTALLAWALVSILAVAACGGGGPAPNSDERTCQPDAHGGGGPHGHAYTTANTYIDPNANAAGDV